jgi:hypothetical protein
MRHQLLQSVIPILFSFSANTKVKTFYSSVQFSHAIQSGKNHLIGLKIVTCTVECRFQQNSSFYVFRLRLFSLTIVVPSALLHSSRRMTLADYCSVLLLRRFEKLTQFLWNYKTAG